MQLWWRAWTRCLTSQRAYKDAYSRINAIVIEGEQEAHDNYIALGTPIRIKRGAGTFMDGDETHEGFHLLRSQPGVEADMVFAKTFFSPCIAISRPLSRRAGW